MAAQPLVLPLGPSHEIRVDASEEWIQPGPVEASVVVDPSLHDFVEEMRKVVNDLSLRRLIRNLVASVYRLMASRYSPP